MADSPLSSSSSPDAPNTTSGADAETRHVPTTEDPTGAGDSLSAAEIQELRQEIDRLDKLILESVQSRTAISHRIGQTRKKSGGPRLVHNRELQVIERFSALGKEGHQLALLLLRLGRGPLG